MKFSSLALLSLAALVSAQNAGAGAPKAPRQAPAGACAAKCFAAPMKSSGCLKDIKPPSGLGMGPMGSAPGSPASLQRRQNSGAATTPRPASPKGSLSPEGKAALSSAKAQAASVKNCLCGGPAFKSALDSCVPSACASATGTADPAVGFAKMVNGICKGASGFTPLTAAPKAGATPA